MPDIFPYGGAYAQNLGEKRNQHDNEAFLLPGQSIRTQKGEPQTNKHKDHVKKEYQSERLGREDPHQGLPNQNHNGRMIVTHVEDIEGLQILVDGVRPQKTRIKRIDNERDVDQEDRKGGELEFGQTMFGESLYWIAWMRC